MALATRLIRGLLAAAILWAIALAVCGRTDLLMLHAFLGTGSVLLLAAMVAIDPDLARERFRRGQTGADPRRRARFRLLPGVW